MMLLPAGYDTPVAERGMRLSVGERQRISIARAFLEDEPTLILEERTRAVDLVLETSILTAMQTADRRPNHVPHRRPRKHAAWLHAAVGVHDGRVRKGSCDAPMPLPPRVPV